MKYWKWLEITAVLCITLLGTVNVWADAQPSNGERNAANPWAVVSQEPSDSSNMKRGVLDFITTEKCSELVLKQKYKEALPLCKKAAEQGDLKAKNNLVLIYSSSGEVPRPWSAVSDSDYYKGLNTAGKTEAAEYYFDKVIAPHFKQNERQKLLNFFFQEIGFSIQVCKRLHTAKQYKQAFPVCRKAAEQGHSDAQFKLALMYANGQGVPQNYAEAMKWWRKAAEQGESESKFNLGIMYVNGYGVKQDYAEGVEWWRKAAKQGNLDAQLSLGVMYANGHGVKQDYVQTVKWYRKAAKQGLAKAQFNMGTMYANGQGVKQDYAEAVKWWRKAAKQGDAKAQFNMGVMYAHGHGVMQNGAAAADWFYKAGLSFLKKGKRDDALGCTERIKNLKVVLHLSVSNAFLADKLLARIYGEGTNNRSSKVKQKKAPSVVTGTGWPVAGGFVVTNHHVVAGRKTIILYRTDGVKIKASVAVDDTTNDLVLLKPDNSKLLPPALPLANSAAQVGGHVFTVGYPHPDMMGKEPKLTDGIVNARSGLGNDPRVYQISVPLQGGNSGGPLINMRGEVVGVTTSKMSAVKVFKWTGDLPQNVNYAVKVGYVRALLSSVDPASNVQVLPVRKDDLSALAKRIEKSVLIVIAQ